MLQYKQKTRRALLLQVLQDPERKSIPSMVKEFIQYWIKKRERPDNYLRHFLYRSWYESPERYLARSEFLTVLAHVRKSPTAPILDNKILFNRYYSTVRGVCLPTYLGHSENGMFHGSDGQSHPFWNVSDVRDLVRRLLNEENSGGARAIFAKSSRGAHGSGVMKITTDSFDQIPWNKIACKDVIFQEEVDQHPAVSKIIPDTLNTIRVTTIRNANDVSIVGSAWMRFGRSGGSVDNASNGGLFIGVDLENGVTRSRAHMKFEHGGMLYSTHPDSGISFHGVQIPLFKEVLKMALTAADAIDYPIVGWDIAVGRQTPVLIEGNAGSEYYWDEIANGVGYLDHPVFGNYMRNVIEGTSR